MKGSVVKLSWSQNGSGEWYATLMLAMENRFEREKLVPGMEFEWELTEERRCTGYAPEQGERVPCPDFKEIDSGSQCGACRGKDIYSDYVRGDQRTELEGEFSVYLAQLGSEVKVGVTRSSKLERRWIEQGADFAAELRSGLESAEALELEQDISEEGLKQRVRKEQKIGASEGHLSIKLDDLGYGAEVRQLSDLTIYGGLSCASLERSGRFAGTLQCVKGQIVSNGKLCMALSSGKVLEQPSQKGIGDF